MKTCQSTLACQSHIIMSAHLNAHNTLYGGKLVEWLDETAGMSASRLVRGPLATATIDHLTFTRPIVPGDSITIKTYVSGVGERSLEIFIKIIGEVLRTGEVYLAGTGFMTWVVRENGYRIPSIVPETAEEIFICQGYQARKMKLKLERQENQLMQKELDIVLP